MEPTDRDVRVEIYDRFAATGKAPNIEDIAKAVSRDSSEVARSLRRLEELHAIALAPSSGSIWMAHPFSAVATPFRIQSGRATYFGNCAWDILAIVALLRLDGVVAARCADSGAPLPLSFTDGEITSGDAVVHIAVPPRRFWDNVGFT